MITKNNNAYENILFGLLYVILIVSSIFIFNTFITIHHNTYSATFTSLAHINNITPPSDIQIAEAEAGDNIHTTVKHEINPDNFDGEIVVATSTEVITMQIDNNGVKHFTNHFIS